MKNSTQSQVQRLLLVVDANIDLNVLATVTSRFNSFRYDKNIVLYRLVHHYTGSL
jgi:hypothetical protein